MLQCNLTDQCDRIKGGAVESLPTESFVASKIPHDSWAARHLGKILFSMPVPAIGSLRTRAPPIQGSTGPVVGTWKHSGNT